MDTLADKAVSKLRGTGTVPGKSKMAGGRGAKGTRENGDGMSAALFIARPLRGTVEQDGEVAQDGVFPEDVGDRTGRASCRSCCEDKHQAGVSPCCSHFLQGSVPVPRRAMSSHLVMLAL